MITHFCFVVQYRNRKVGICLLIKETNMTEEEQKEYDKKSKAYKASLDKIALTPEAINSATTALSEDKIAILAVEDIPAITEAVPCAVPLSLIERQIIELYAANMSKRVIAAKLGIPKAAVDGLFKRKGVQEFANSLVMASNFAIKAERVRLISSIIEANVTMLEEAEVDLAMSTTKDVVDLTMNLDHILKEQEKKELGVTDGNNVYINILQQMMDGEG